GEAIPAEAGGFDLVWLSLVIHHHPDLGKLETLREVRRVLRPGGWAAIRDADVAARQPILPLPIPPRARVESAFPAPPTPRGGGRGGEGWAPLGGPHDLYTGRALPRLLGEAGFERLAVRGYLDVYRQPLTASDRRVLESTLISGWRGRVLEARLEPAEWQQLV